MSDQGKQPDETQKVETLRSLKFTRCWLSIASVVLPLLCTAFVWHYTVSDLNKLSQERFTRETTDLIGAFDQHIRSYGDVLNTSLASVQNNQRVLSQAQWRALVGNIHADLPQPALSGLGLTLPVLSTQKIYDNTDTNYYDVNIETVNKQTPGLHLPIVYAEPDVTVSHVVGIDLSLDNQIRAAVFKARDTGNTVMTNVEFSDVSGAPFAYLYTPFYRVDSAWTLQDRRRHLIGWLFSRIDVEYLINSFAKWPRTYSLSIKADNALFYEQHTIDSPFYDAKPLFTRQVSSKLFGQPWTFEIQTNQEFRKHTRSRLPVIIIVGGILTTALFLLTLLQQSSFANKKSKLTSQNITGLEQEVLALQRNNADLESFAYVVSHDLKTPLGGIKVLIQLLDEELEDQLKKNDRRLEVGDYIEKMNNQVERMGDLIKGILDYSTIALKNEPIEMIDTRDTISSIVNSLSVSQEKVILTGDFPSIQTYRVRFEQTLTNLIGNAFKYHNNPEIAKVEISVATFGDFYSFSIIDNGPGIDPKNHERIFEVFESVKTKETDGSGVGLSIVKKSVESLGGIVSVESELGNGTTFRFLWPKAVDEGELTG